MRRIKNVRLAFNPDWYEHFQNPIWTFDFDSDIDVVAALEKCEFEKEYIFNPPREQYKKGTSSELDFLINSVSTELNSVFPEIISKHEQIVRFRWLRESANILKNANTHTKIFKDVPGFQMSPHLDNSFMIGNAIINLVDNVNSTAFHDYRDHERILFKAPKEKNTGVLFLNTPGCLHSIKNTSDRDRYMMNTSFFIKGIT
jgi:hypothetical protein